MESPLPLTARNAPWKAPPYLQQRILPVHVPLMALRQHFNVPPELFHLCQAHNFAPLVVDFDAVHVRVCGLALGALPKGGPCFFGSLLFG